jgi:hypothetical protein
MTTSAPPIAGAIVAPRTSRWPIFGWFAFLFLIASQVTAILISPPDRDMGHLEKILYVHVPAAWMTMLAPLTVLFFGLRYLWQRREQDDLLAAAAAEVAAAFAGLTVILGMIWARPTWGVWWTWDARTTSTLVLFDSRRLPGPARADRRSRPTRSVECGRRDPRRDQRADRVYVRPLVAHHPPDSIEPVDGRPGVRHRTASQRVRVPLSHDLLHSPSLRSRVDGACRRACRARSGARSLRGSK